MSTVYACVFLHRHGRHSRHESVNTRPQRNTHPMSNVPSLFGVARMTNLLSSDVGNQPRPYCRALLHRRQQRTTTGIWGHDPLLFMCALVSPRFVFCLQQQTACALNDHSSAKGHVSLIYSNSSLIAHTLGDMGYFCVMKKTLWAPPSLFTIANTPICRLLPFSEYSLQPVVQ